MYHNQETLKKTLDSLVEEKYHNYKMIFSGKKSKKLDGVYHPETLEIIIHNKNFKLWNTMILTGIHELAHHIEFSDGRGISNRAHGEEWKKTYYTLLKKSMELGYYEDPYKQGGAMHKEAVAVRVVDNKLALLNKEFGRVLLGLYAKTQELGHDFQDFTDRVLGRTKQDIIISMEVYAKDENPEYGLTAMKKLAKSTGEEKDRITVELSENMPGIKPRETKEADKDAEVVQIQHELSKLERRIEKDLARKQNLEEMLEALGGCNEIPEKRSIS